MALPRYRAVLSGVRMLASGDRTGWLGREDSNSEMSTQIIPSKGRTDFRGPAEFQPQRLFAFELRRWGTQLGPRAKIWAGCLLGVGHRGASLGSVPALPRALKSLRGTPGVDQMVS